ncbi:MAG: DUF2141 domain-containing protein [Candidatus Binataceae bacterium]|nr:DUF2141 domain-containing protein [Candidatus Binataceae bacterium]
MTGLVLAMLAAASSGVAASPVKNLQIVVAGLRNNSGKVVCTLWHSAQGFPRDDTNAQTTSVPIENRSATCSFPALPAGAYAAVAYHDENNNGKFDTNWMGLPLEGYGFSNNVSISWRPPNFKEAGFHYDGAKQQITIRIKY